MFNHEGTAVMSAMRDLTVKVLGNLEIASKTDVINRRWCYNY